MPMENRPVLFYMLVITFYYHNLEVALSNRGRQTFSYGPDNEYIRSYGPYNFYCHYSSPCCRAKATIGGISTDGHG